MDDVVLGVGNVLMGDEGLGVRAAERLRDRAPPGVRVVEAGALGPTTLVEVEGARHLLVLDAVDAGLAPGSIVRFEGADLVPHGPVLSAHEFGVTDLLALLAQRGDLPEETILLGMQPAVLEPRVSLSPEVEAALSGLVETALDVLSAWS